MGIFGKGEAAVVESNEDLKTQIDAKKKEIEQKERDLQAQLEREQEDLQDMETALKRCSMAGKGRGGGKRDWPVISRPAQKRKEHQ
ncbi:MAG: hypothetical protein SCARUB_01329 [Candidatus Scalindua rubra]|uniref:Uncharacterized protein n=1 Tax=Candidatus Scalindua rubra TaxID=1872076 RepID=A0A1E3XCY8_9BACT|nr:MAG: hypothetical protein SCARUB_01329 [Candidatus Scalindua rubra]